MSPETAKESKTEKEEKKVTSIDALFGKLTGEERTQCFNFQNELRESFNGMLGKNKLAHPVLALIAINNVRLEFEDFLAKKGIITRE